MACPHAPGCPLFPYLNASLGAWRVSYCDHSNGWRGCARFLLTGQGKPVPLALLPNGRMPVAMLPSMQRADTLQVTHQLPAQGPVGENGQPARTLAAEPAHQDWTRRDRTEQHQIEQHQIEQHQIEQHQIERDWTQQDWGTAPRPPWWRRLLAWLGGTE